MSAMSVGRAAGATVTAVFVAAVAALTGQGNDTLFEGLPAASRAAEAAALRARGQLLGYNLDRDARLEPQGCHRPIHRPAAYRLTAALWIKPFSEAVTAEDYLGQRGRTPRRHPSAELERVVREHLDRAIRLADERCRTSGSADAHFQLGSAYGYQATYAATIEGSLFGTLRGVAPAEHERCRARPDPQGRELIVGMYRARSPLSLHRA
jgi:hypothetical protein